MAMTKCKECNKEVSTSADNCPHCGVDNPGGTFLDSLIGFIILGIIGWGIYHFVFNNVPNIILEPITTVQTDYQNNESFDCKIDAWKFEKTSSRYITIDGTTTCNDGRLDLKVYDGDSKYIGNSTTYIRSGIFKTVIRTSDDPDSIKVNFTITKR